MAVKPQTQTVEKYLGFLIVLRLKLQSDKDFKISHLLKEMGVNNNIMNVLIDLGQIKRVARGTYEWHGDFPTQELAEQATTRMFAMTGKGRLPDHAPLEAEVDNLKKRVTELEDLVLQLMGSAA